MRKFRHRRSGREYELVGRAGMQIDSVAFHKILVRDNAIMVSRKLESLSFVVYRAVADDTLWVRPESEFFDGVRFVEIETGG